jgi:hypothetical protein
MRLYANNAEALVAVTVSAIDLAITLDDASTFPIPTGGDTYRATLHRADNTLIEIVEVTAAVGNVLTVVRAQEGTSAGTFNVGDRVEMRLTKEILESFALTAHTEHVYIDLTPATAPAHIEGRIAYDSDNKGFIGYVDETEVTLNIGEELWVRARNNTGVAITNGQAVYISGATGNKPTIALGQADARATSETIGIATHDIENNTEGFITTYGLVRDVDTSAFIDGDELYLSDTTPGALTATKPTADASYKLPVAHVLNAHVNQGIIFIHTDTPMDFTDMAMVGAINGVAGDFSTLAVAGVDAVDLSSAQTLTNKTIPTHEPVDAKIVRSNATTVFTKQQNFSQGTLADGANISWNLDNDQVAKVTINGARTLDNPTNVVDGGTYVLKVIQGTGGDTLAYGANFDFGAEGAPTLSATSGKMDLMTFVGGASSKMHYVGISKGHTP